MLLAWQRRFLNGFGCYCLINKLVISIIVDGKQGCDCAKEALQLSKESLWRSGGQLLAGVPGDFRSVDFYV